MPNELAFAGVELDAIGSTRTQDLQSAFNVSMGPRQETVIEVPPMERQMWNRLGQLMDNGPVEDKGKEKGS